MVRRLPLDAIDSRVVLITYAAVVGGTGFFLFAWGSLWLGGPLLGNPWGLNTIIRVIGAVVMGAACCAWGAGRIKDPSDRRAALTWLVIGHTIVLAVAAMQAYAVWGPELPQPAWWALVAFAALWTALLGAWMRQGGDAAPFTTYVYGLFGEQQPGPGDVLRSQYEEQLRLAGAREERHRFARDLHDSVKQQVFAIQTAAATAEVRLDSDLDGAREAIARVRDAGRDAMAEMDAMLAQLGASPSDNAGLVEALRKQADACAMRTGSEVHFERDALPASVTWPPGAHDAIFRSAQEALSNVARHARATRVDVRLRTTPFHVVLDVHDNGSGFDAHASPTGMGLDNIRSRGVEVGGTVEVVSPPEGGTRVTLSVPYERDEPARFWKKAAFATVVAITMIVALLTSGPARVAFLILAAPALMDVARYLLAGIKARRLMSHTA
ncbi:MAG: sensor histidine kinase [Acidobacteriota bacterium]